MTNVVGSDHESFESLLRRFSRKVQEDGVLSELRRRKYYEKPSVKRKRKEAATRRRKTRAMRR